jgi:hypothetical protein
MSSAALDVEVNGSIVIASLMKPRPNPSLNTDVPHAGATPPAAGRRLAPIR